MAGEHLVPGITAGRDLPCTALLSPRCNMLSHAGAAQATLSALQPSQVAPKAATTCGTEAVTLTLNLGNDKLSHLAFGPSTIDWNQQHALHTCDADHLLSTCIRFNSSHLAAHATFIASVLCTSLAAHT